MLQTAESLTVFSLAGMVLGKGPKTKTKEEEEDRMRKALLGSVSLAWS